MNSTCTMNSIRKLLFLQYPGKAGGQVTVAATVTAIMTNHCSSQKKKNFTQVKADSLPDFPQHPMLLSTYIRELTPQYSAGSIFSQISSLFSKGFHSRNTLEVQSSFRNSILNTIHCKPQLAIYFTFRIYLVSEPSRLIPNVCNLPPFWYQSQVWLVSCKLLFAL